MTPPIFLLGEAQGEHEAKIGAGFVGASGAELLRMLDEAGTMTLTGIDHDYISRFFKTGNPENINMIWNLHADEFYRSNVFQQHPPGNHIEWFCGSKAEGIKGYPALLKSKYVRQEFYHELDRLGDEIIRVNPNLIVALGNTALWALCGKTGISKLRGTTCLSTHTVRDFKLLPAYHPAGILRQWENRPVTVADFVKANRERAFPELRRPQRWIHIPESIDDLYEFKRNHIDKSDSLATDIETSGTRVTCIGFAPTRTTALVIPLDDERKLGRSYWPTKELELLVWKFIREVLEQRRTAKTFQNGLYDIAFLWRAYGIKVYNAEHDTMLLHHALQPESLKGLGFLGSVYTDEGAWKQERGKTKTIKRDE